MRKRSLWGLALVALSAIAQAQGLEDEWGAEWGDDEESSPWMVDGFVELSLGNFLQSNVVESGSSLSEIRGRLNIDYSHEQFEITTKGDVWYDNVLDKDIWRTREFYIASSMGPVDIRAGRQVLTWGTGDYLFLNDLFAKDWQSFFAGRDDEYLKAPSDSLRITSYLKSVTVDFAWTPRFTPDAYINGERFSFYSPIVETNVAPEGGFHAARSDGDQWSLRLATTLSGVEMALYGYQGFWSTPVGADQGGNRYFPEMDAIGFSALTPLAGGLFNLEVSHYDSREDSEGDDPLIANSQTRLLIGFEREAARNFKVGAQYYLEKVEDYSNYRRNYPFQDGEADENRHLLTLRLSYSMRQQTLNLSLFSFYSPSDDDAYLKPSVSYRYSDKLSLSLGANIFIGDRPFTFFGQHEDNSNAWIRIRYSY